MKRREFIMLSVFGGTAMTVPLLHCTPRSKALDGVLGRPQTLSNLCDTTTILEIGRSYRERTPVESDREILANLLLQDAKGNDMTSSQGDSAVSSMLKEKIRQDFETGQTVIIKGWVLSATEARQCAYFSFTHP